MPDEFRDKKSQSYKDKCEWCEFNKTLIPESIEPKPYEIKKSLKRKNFDMMACSNGHAWWVWKGRK